MFRATMCTSSGADECVVLSSRVGIVPWLQEGCQNRLAGSVSTGVFVVVLRTPQWTHYLLTGSIEDFLVVLRTPQWTHYLLTGSIEDFVVVLRTPQWTHYLLTGSIEDFLVVLRTPQWTHYC